MPTEGITKFEYSITVNEAVMFDQAGLVLSVLYGLENGPLQFHSIAFNETVDVFDAPYSNYDLKSIFLYLVVAGFLGGLSYLVYKIWLESLLGLDIGKKKRRRVSKTSSADRSKKNAASISAKSGASHDPDSSSQDGFDQDWIPVHHLKSSRSQPKQRPATRQKKSK